MTAAPRLASLPLFAACAPGLEPLLLAEVAGLGLGPARAEPGGVAIAGGAADAVDRACLGLGLALRVQVELAAFPVGHLAELERRAAKLPWAAWLGRAPTVVRASCRRSRVYHSGAVEERILAAIDAALGGLPAAEEGEGDDDAGVTQRVMARIVRDRLTISLDASGALHRRGYRAAGLKAPLREDLARALVVASRWDRERPLCDPLCGSGTVAIEADWLARGVPPGHLRAPPLLGGPLHDAVRHAGARARLLEAARAGGPEVPASDRDAGAVSTAAAQAGRAGARVTVTRAAMSEALAAEGPRLGAVVTNPPWGKRVGSPGPLRDLYASLGRALGDLPPDAAIGVLTASPELARRLGARLVSAFLTDAGGVKVRALVRPS